MNRSFSNYDHQLHYKKLDTLQNRPSLQKMMTGYEELLANVYADDINVFKKLMCPVDSNRLVQCTLEREKSYFFQEATFRLCLSDTGTFILGAKKIKSMTSYYHISMYEKVFDKSKGFLGKLRSNLLNNQYNM